MPKNSSRRIARDRFWSSHDKNSYTCPDCGRGLSEINGTFEVHHQNGNAYDNKLDNLIALCQVCHALREERSPSKEAVRNLRDVNTSNKSEHTDDNVLFLALDEIISEFRSKVLVYDWSPSNNKPMRDLSDYLGYESGEDMLSVKPKNRREAALFLSGRETNAQRAHEIIQPMLESARSNARCVVCGSDDEGSPGLVSMPDSKYGDVRNRRVFCGSCARRTLDMVDGPVKSWDDISEKMRTVETNSSSENTSQREEKSISKSDYDICHVSGCDSEPDVIYEFEKSPKPSKHPHPKAMRAPVCDSCKGSLNESDDFPNGRVLADLDFIFEHVSEFNV